MKSTPFSLVFLAGGHGSRMGSPTPKQYLKVGNYPLAFYSFSTFLCLEELEQIVVVCESAYKDLFIQIAKNKKHLISFALPGERRQDSVANGLEKLQGNPLVCIHDSARPFIEKEAIRRTVAAAEIHQAAVLGVRLKSTIKICDAELFVTSTPDRSHLWEVQTPQVIRLNLLKEGFLSASKEKKTVTDDVSFVEFLGKPVKMVEGSYKNFKITTPEDLEVMHHVLLQTPYSL